MSKLSTSQNAYFFHEAKIRPEALLRAWLRFFNGLRAVILMKIYPGIRFLLFVNHRYDCTVPAWKPLSILQLLEYRINSNMIHS